jgi:hypothetical protein
MDSSRSASAAGSRRCSVARTIPVTSVARLRLAFSRRPLSHLASTGASTTEPAWRCCSPAPFRTSSPAGDEALVDLGFRGLDNDIRDPVIVTGYAASRTHKLTPGQKYANRVLTGRAPVEHGFAHLKNWRILAKFRTNPAWPPRLLRALLVLTNLEVNRFRMISSADSRPRPA